MTCRIPFALDWLNLWLKHRLTSPSNITSIDTVALFKAHRPVNPWGLCATHEYRAFVVVWILSFAQWNFRFFLNFILVFFFFFFFSFPLLEVIWFSRFCCLLDISQQWLMRNSFHKFSHISVLCGESLGNCLAELMHHSAQYIGCYFVAPKRYFASSSCCSDGFTASRRSCSGFPYFRKNPTAKLFRLSLGA